jgi:diguanylate cyclase (GGDEF)-like protein
MLLVSLFFIVVLMLLSASNVRQAKLLKRENLRYEALFETSHEYLFEFEQKRGKIVFSPQTIALFGSLRRQDQAMQALSSVMKRAEDSTFSSIVDLKVRDGSLRRFRISIVKVVDPFKRAESCIGRLSDISEEEREKADLLSRVVTDGLTGLLNQVAVREQIEQSMVEKPAGRLDFLVLMDCDRFKQVNDTYGHLAGDRFLKILGESLVSTFSDDPIIGRVGGDEFCVYIPGADSIEAVLDQCNLINPTFQQRIKAPFTVSIGLTAVEADDEYDSLFRRADIALYQVKREGGGTVTYYLPSMGN